MATRGRRRGPTVLEIWSPKCVDCKAMQPDLDAIAHEYRDRVHLELVNANDELETVRGLGVRSTPTLIGLRNDEELFRVVGRRTRSELERLFESVASGDDGPHVGLQDAMLRLLAGAALLALGFFNGPAWPVLGAGAAIIPFGVISWLKQ